MASVRLKKGSSHWFACFKLPTGKVNDRGAIIMRRVQRSTGLADRTRALQIAISYERAAVAASEQRWSENAARRFLSEIAAVTGVEMAETERAQEYLKRWLKGRRRSLAPASYTRYEGIVEDFLEFLGNRAKGPLGEITATRVVEFRDGEVAAGKSPRTVNKSLMVLAQAFAEAVTMGLLPANPARGINVRGEKKSAQKRRAFAFVQFRELVVATAGKTDWQTLLMLCGYTGGRQQEVAKIQWEQIDLEGGKLTLHRSKNADEHWLPIHASLLAHLRARAGGVRRHGPVMPWLSTVQRRSISNYFRRDILPLIGIVQAFDQTEGKGKGRRLAEYSIHSLRHSLSTWLNEAGVPEMMRMRLVGHEDEEVSRGYTHTELAQAAKELAKVPGI